jgi:hypothetical protein
MAPALHSLRVGTVRRTGGRDQRPVEHQGGAAVAQKYNGYCVKCKEKRDFDGRVEVTKTGMNMAKGTCPVCGTKMNRILGKAKV